MTAGKWRDEKTLDKQDEQEPNGRAGMAGTGTEVTKHHKTQQSREATPEERYHRQKGIAKTELIKEAN